MPSNITTEIISAHDNSIFIGTIGGLVKYENDAWFKYNFDNSGFPTGVINAMSADSEGGVWVCVSNKLVSIKNSTCEVYYHENSELPDDTLKTIAIDANKKNGSELLNTV